MRLYVLGFLILIVIRCERWQVHRQYLACSFSCFLFLAAICSFFFILACFSVASLRALTRFKKLRRFRGPGTKGWNSNSWKLENGFFFSGCVLHQHYSKIPLCLRVCSYIAYMLVLYLQHLFIVSSCIKTNAGTINRKRNTNASGHDSTKPTNQQT